MQKQQPPRLLSRRLFVFGLFGFAVAKHRVDEAA